jgi:hypothetical protein
MNPANKKSCLDQFLSVENVTPFIKKLGHFLWTCFFLGLALALEAPEDILTSIPFLKQFTTFMRWIVPCINGAVTQSKFPQITELYLSISWALSPLYLIYSWGRYYCGIGFGVKRVLSSMKEKRAATLLRGLWNLVLIIFIAFSFFFYLFHYDGSDLFSSGIIPLSKSRLTLGLVGWLIAGGGMIILANLLWWVTPIHVRQFLYLLKKKT